jgi:hypothetical protein
VTDKFFILSLGQSGEQRAVQMIKRSQKEDDWIFLQNCHLYSSFLLRLEQIVNKWM